MFRVKYHVSPQFTVEADGATHAEVFGNLAGLVESFSMTVCGLCRNADVIPVKRVVDDVAHYEMKCRDCGARLTLAQNKKGGSLYPRRKYHKDQSEVKAGRARADDFIPNHGWEKWSGERNDEE